ncbi:LysM peptidoglycan-binding domain-containing protein [Vagococcus humatus]|uniref:Peptidoglycan hydrolase n=1 Tax=Vagococcus humatus TaxID=1889241 RepID=A0A3R9YDW8_9ENTE|nr:LysM peptidoglycan-binding domain-containing protein [Vagococcus humatus]RST89002.1 muramidase [Vagococcus humatus]
MTSTTRRCLYEKSHSMIPTVKQGLSFLGLTMFCSTFTVPQFLSPVYADELDKTKTEQTVDEVAGESSKTDDTQQSLLKEEPVQTVTPEVVQPMPNYTARMTPATFIQQIGPLAQSVAAANDLYASIMIAQGILESGWGTSVLSASPNHNLYGIKGSYNGQSVVMQTKEFLNGQWVTIHDSFRKYPSYQESLQDNANVLKNTSFSPGNYFYSGAWKSRTNSYRDASQWLTGRYATDPGYAGKLNRLIEAHQLTRFDTPGGNLGESVPDDSNNQELPDPKPGIHNPAGQTYTVISGDTLYRISQKFGVSLSELKSWNNLTSDVIYVGQTLVVSNSDQPTTPPETTSPETNKPEESKPTPEKPVQGKIYLVAAGDNLYRLAQKFNISLSDLRAWNNLTSDTIYIGQQLIVGAQTIGNQPAPSKPTETKPTQHNKYQVVQGDTLYRISQKFGVSVPQLKSWNNLTSDVIYVGQTLRIGQGSASQTNPNQPTPSKPNQVKNYQVVKGDTLYRISQKFGVSLAQLKSWNNLTSDVIYVGQTLKVKATKTQETPHNNKPSTPTTTQGYRVKKGDTLYSIAKKTGISLAELKQLNGMKSDLIYVGQSLKVLANTSSTPTSNQTNQTVKPDSTSQAVYKVKAGDTLYRIAKELNISLLDLKNWNQLRSDDIAIGQKLVIKENSKVEKYQVKKGDTLFRIALEHGLSVKELKQLNQLKTEAIQIGQILQVS